MYLIILCQPHSSSYSYNDYHSDIGQTLNIKEQKGHISQQLFISYEQSKEDSY